MDVTSKIRSAVCEGNTGVTFTAKQVIALVMAKYPDTNPSSITVSDRAQSDKQSKPYAEYLFERVSGGYKVLAPENRVKHATGSRSRGLSDAEALAAAVALIASHKATQQSQTVVPEVLPNIAAEATKPQGKANGKSAN